MCTLCEESDIGDEFHYLFVCNFFHNSHVKFLYHYYYTRPSTYKFKQLINSKKIIKEISEIYKCICQVFKRSHNKNFLRYIIIIALSYTAITISFIILILLLLRLLLLLLGSTATATVTTTSTIVIVINNNYYYYYYSLIQFLLINIFTYYQLLFHPPVNHRVMIIIFIM